MRIYFFLIFVTLASCKGSDHGVKNDDPAKSEFELDSLRIEGSSEKSTITADSLKTLNLIEVDLSRHVFKMPMNSENLIYVFKHVRLDSPSLRQISKARLVSVTSPCKNVLDVSDSTFFSDDFNPSDASSRVFNMCIAFYEDINQKRQQHFVISDSQQERIYLLTYESSYNPDTIKIINAVMIHNRMGNTGFWGYRRNATFFTPTDIRLNENCWSYPVRGEKGTVYRNSITISIDNNHRIKVRYLKTTQIDDR